jgi:type III restriction enzyme
MSIPDEVKVKGLSAEEGGRLSLLGPGRTADVNLDAWRATRRLQELEFELATALTRRYSKNPGCEAPAHVLFPQMLGIVRQFLQTRVEPVGRTNRKDVFLDPYFTWAVSTLSDAVLADDEGAAEVPRYESHRGPGSTHDVDFWTSKPVKESERSHLSWVVMDTDRWEQTTAFYLDTDEHVRAFVKNFNLGFAIPYSHAGDAREYLPDFLVRLQADSKEIGKGYDPAAEAKAGGARRWVAAVNAEGSYGRWAYRMIKAPTETAAGLRGAVEELLGPPPTPPRRETSAGAGPGPPRPRS